MKNEQKLHHKLVTFGRIVKTGSRNLFRNAWLSVAAIAVMLVALTIILLAVVLNVTARGVISELSSNLKVSVYLLDDAPVATQSELERAIQEHPHTNTVEFVSKDEAQRRFLQSFENDPELLAGLALVGGDSLPASYEISVTDLNRLEEVGNIANQEQYNNVVESVTLGRTDAKKTIDRAASMQRFITTASILAAAVFTIISVLIIFNTIRIAIFTRSEEIRSMKLIGATPGYIRGPFLIEASIYGVIAGVAATAIVYSLIFSVGSGLENQAEFAATHSFFTEYTTIIAIFFSTILLGILVGIFSSSLAMEKYLKLKRW
ncbi:MAG: permease-like cell division protein FtsX [Candidatus Saccharibacteria bacterium]|nr:permease-like cell division protein FtsX [Candidatus Saccharibacteria bacterium]